MPPFQGGFEPEKRSRPGGTDLPVKCLSLADKPLIKPGWYKNTSFPIGLILFIVGIIGLPFLGGDHAIRDPGQKRESGLAFIYFGAAVVMIVNGFISHGQTVQSYNESVELKEKNKGREEKNDSV